MSEFGLRIRNYQASTVYECNLGVREKYDFKEAMFSNSLFLDFLLENDIEVRADGSTRDIIGLDFDYGTRSYEKEEEHLKKIARKALDEYRHAYLTNDTYALKKIIGKREKINQLLLDAHKNKDDFISLSKNEIRTFYYNNGVDIKYPIWKRTKTSGRSSVITGYETIHYKMLYRSTGKAKKGSCMFIREELFDKARKFLYMGIKLPYENPMIVEISAYAPLSSSAIVGRVKIDPSNILVLKDVDRFMTSDVISIETDEEKHCHAIRRKDYKVKNTLFDGQALIDSSIFPEWGNGYILLRHHFCKMAAFSSNIQLFFKDYFGDDYETATVTDMFGNTMYVKDVLLITTDNAMKWLKFDVGYDYWSEWVRANGCNFGIVKTAHESKLGMVQKMSYQMINALDLNTMDKVVQESVDYITKLKFDDEAFLDYLDKNKNFSNDFEVLIALVKQDPMFVRCDYFRKRRETIIKNYVLNFRSGKVIQNGENLVIVGSPYAMLLYATCGDESIVDMDDTFVTEEVAIQCYTPRFNDGEYLAEFRSPFNGRNNMGYLHNKYDDRLIKYFNFTNQIVAVNMNGTNFQDKNNGSDMDSDSIYTTNQEAIVSHAKWCCENYLTIVNNIPKEKNVYYNTLNDYALIDNNTAASQLTIGESSNLAQLALTYSYNYEDSKYEDFVAVLSVLAQVSIDNAKRKFDIDLTSEIKRIKDDMDIQDNKYPVFWGIIKKGFNKKNINKQLVCPMNYLSKVRFKQDYASTSTLPISFFFMKYPLDVKRHKCIKVEELISKYSLNLLNGAKDDSVHNESDFVLRSDFEDLINDIRQVSISKNYVGLMSWLIDRAFIVTPKVKGKKNIIETKLSKNKTLLLNTLYQVNKNNLLSCFSANI